MENAKLNFYFFGDIGQYDSYNPAYICNKEYASQVLYLIASNEPFSISKFEIAEILKLKEEIVENIINNLKLINAIEVKNNTYRIKFPVFLEKDVIEMENYINNAGKIVGNKIIQIKNVLYKQISKLRCAKYHNYERILYHIICDKIFDGTAFEFFTQEDVFCASKLQPGNRDYIIVAYEDSESVEKYSNKLLCSSNNYTSHGFTFNSFGDSNGLRKDMYRTFRLVQQSVNESTPFHELNIYYNRILDNMNSKTAYECGVLIRNIINNEIKYTNLSEKEKNLAKFLNELDYISISSDNLLSINVPVFYDFEMSKNLREISDIILKSIFPTLKQVFDNFETNVSQSTSVRHKVDIKETANELWHQIFGAANEYLVKEKFVALPDNIDGQGRYLKSLIISQN